MTVSNESSRTSAVGTGAEQIVPFTFPITLNSDITVTARVTSTGVESNLDETTHYTVINNGTQGGSISTVTPFVATTSQIYIVRNTPMTQSLNLVNGGNFNAENIETALDKNTRLVIENSDEIARSISMPATDAVAVTTVLPSSIDRASKVCSFDSAGNVTASTAVPTGSVSFTTFGTNMAEAATALAGKSVINLDLQVDVRDYGATGDGITDDTVAIQTAFTAAGTTGRVYFPNGTYIVSEAGGLPITFSPDNLVIGESRAGVIISNTDITEFVFQFLSDVVGPLDSYPNPGGFMHMQINSKHGIRLNQTLAEVGGIWSGDWNLQDIPIGWKVHDISFKGIGTSSGDANANTNTEPASVSDYTTYGIGLKLVRPFLTDISQCAFRSHGVGIYLEGADLQKITNNRFIGNSCHIYASNGTDSTYGFNTIVSHNDILTCYRRRHIWIDGQDAKLGAWSICNNFFESSGAQAELIYESGCFAHKIFANFFNGTNQLTTGTPIMSFVNSSKAHLVYGNSYGASVNTPAIHVEGMTGTIASKRWIHFFGNAQDFPLPDNPRGVLGTQETTDPFRFDCVQNQQKFEEGTAHSDIFDFAKFDGFYHLDTSTGTVDIFFRDGQVYRLTDWTVRIQGVVTGGADGNDDIKIIVLNDATTVWPQTDPIVENVTDGDLIDVSIQIQSSQGVKRIFFLGDTNGFIAISSVEIIPGITGNKVYYEDNDVSYENNEVVLNEISLSN